eukprot:1129238-Ditylum_brightwellii.AAC.1
MLSPVLMIIPFLHAFAGYLVLLHMLLDILLHVEKGDDINDGKFVCHAHANMQEDSLEPVEQQEVQSSPNTDTAAAAASNVWTPVIIQADPCGAFAGAKLLLPHIDYKVEDVVLDIPIQQYKYSLIIGQMEFMIALLSADYKAHIIVPYQQSSATAMAGDGGGG